MPLASQETPELAFREARSPSRRERTPGCCEHRGRGPFAEGAEPRGSEALLDDVVRIPELLRLHGGLLAVFEVVLIEVKHLYGPFDTHTNFVLKHQVEKPRTVD